MLEMPIYRDLIKYWFFPESFNAVITELTNESIKSPTDCWGVEFFVAPPD
jgi:hypothetical protein